MAIHPWNNVYNRWITGNLPFRWHRKTSTSGWKSSIFNRNCSGERRPKFIASGEDNDNKKPRVKHREHRLAQRRQPRQHSDHKHVQRQRQNTTITLQMEPMKRGKTDRRRFKKRWGDQATLTVYGKIVFDATIGSNSYTICTMHVKNIFPVDWGKPTSLYTMSNIGFHSKLFRFAPFRFANYSKPMKCTTRLGALDLPRSSAHKAKEFVGFLTLFSHLFVNLDDPKLLRN